MMASMIIRLFGLAVLAGIVATAVVLWRRAVRNPLFLPAAKRKTGPLGRARIACGVLGGFVLLGTVYGTLMTVRASYASVAVPANMTVRVPTRPVSLEGVAPGEAPRNVRLLATLLLQDLRGTEPRPLCVKQMDIRWPTHLDLSKPIEPIGGARTSFRFKDLECTYNVSISRIVAERPEGGAEGHATALRVLGYQTISWKGSLGYRGGDGSSLSQLTDTEIRVFPGTASFGSDHMFRLSPLSVTPATPARYYGLVLFMAANEDDPLQTIPVEEFVQPIRPILDQGGIYGQPATIVVDDLRDMPAGGIRLTVYLLGIPMLLLVAAAGLLSQVFRRRDLAMVGLLLGVVLYVAAFDRALLAYDLSRLTDAKETLQARLVACSRVGATFFYRDTAMQSLEAVVRQEAADTPPMLSERIRSMIAYLAEQGSRRSGRG